MVASPRNQRYLHPRSFGAGVSVCEVDEVCKLAIKLDPELPVFPSKRSRASAPNCSKLLS
jgi:hypothetical protein